MTQLQTTMISLIRQALIGKTASLPETVDWEAIFKLAKSHKLLPLLAETISQNKTVPPEIHAKVHVNMLKELFISENQMQEIANIREAFISENIDFVLLKGAELKMLYPNHYMRPMGDSDILVRMEQYPRIIPLMRSLGYTEVSENEHELVWDKGIIHIELHKCLIPPYNKDLFAYFGDGWNLARQDKADTSEYHFQAEDNFVYLFSHFTKHYRRAGIGILHVLDLQVYLTANPHLDMEYIAAQMEQLHLYSFYTYVCQMMRNWFAGAEPNEKTDFLTETIFSSKQFGSNRNKELSDALRVSAKTKNPKFRKLTLYMRKIFPSRVDLAEQYYSWLNRLSFLLPVAWVMYWFHVLLYKRDSIQLRREEIQKIASSEIDEFQKNLQYVGLDYFF